MKKNKIENLFQEKLGNLQVEPSDRAKALFEEKIRRKKRIIWIKRISVAASIVLLITAGLYFVILETENSTLTDNVESEVQETPRRVQSERTISRETTSPAEAAQRPEKTVEDQSNLLETGHHGPETREIRVTEAPDDGTTKNGQTDPVIDEYDSGTGLETTVLAESEIERSEIIIPEDSRINEVKQLKDGKDIHRSLSDRDAASLALNEDKKGTFNMENPSVASEPVVEDGRKNNNGTVDLDEKSSMAISIEYIPSESQNKGNNLNVKELYEKMNNLVYPEEVLGDIRSFKDQLFAFEFIKERKDKNSK